MKKYLAVGVFALGVALNPLSALAELKPLGPNTYQYFSDWYGSLVVVGEKSVLVVDPAWDARAEKMKAEIAQVTDKKVSHVVLTHEHYDHVGGTEVFQDAKVVCHESCQAIFDLDVMDMAPDKVDQEYREQLDIDLGGITTEIRFLGVGDGVATSVIYVPEDDVIATADMYLPNSLANGMWLEDKNYLGSREILNIVSEWDLKYAVNGHNPDTNPSALLENRDYMNELYTAVKKELDTAIKSGGTDAAFALISGELSDKVKLPKYAKWEGYKEHFPKHVWRMAMSIMHGG